MIDLQAVTARDSTPARSIWGGPPVRGIRTIAPLTLTLGAGAHALLGTLDDGVSLLLALIAGDVRARSGRVQVLGGSPGDAAIRRSIAHVPLDVSLPDPVRVAEALVMAAEIRGEPARDPVARLEVLGIAALAKRKVNTLGPDEARAVAMAEAVTSQARVLLIFEPYVTVDPRTAPLLRDVLSKRASEGVCVLVATASVNDAAALADDHLVFERGSLVRRGTSMEGISALASRGGRLRVVVSGAKQDGAKADDANANADGTRALVAALAAEGAITSVETSGTTLVVGGADLVALASAVARAALRADVGIEALGPDVVTLEELRASMAGNAAGAYRRAFAEGRSTATAIPPAEGTT